MTASYQARLTPALALDLASRGIDEAPFDRIAGPADLELTASEAQLLLDDCDLYGDEDGPGASLSFGLRMAYRRLGQQLETQGLRPTPVADPDRDHRPSYGPPKPKAQLPLGELEPGAWIDHPVLGRCVTGSEERIPARRRTPELVPLHKQGALGELVWRASDEAVELL